MAFPGREKHMQSLKVPGRKEQMDFLGRSNEKRISSEAEGEEGEKQTPVQSPEQRQGEVSFGRKEGSEHEDKQLYSN